MYSCVSERGGADGRETGGGRELLAVPGAVRSASRNEPVSCAAMMTSGIEPWDAGGSAAVGGFDWGP